MPSQYVRKPGQSPAKSPPSASALAPYTGYGISGDYCTFLAADGAYHFCHYQSSAWNALKTGQRLIYTRIIVPWDAVYTWSANGCVNNKNANGQWLETDHSGNAIIADLIRFGVAARNDGLIPVVTLGSGNGAGQAGGYQEPYWPNANSSYGIYGTGDYQYSCGFYGLASTMKTWGVPVYNWEVYNEPDDPQATGGNIPSNVAANYYVDAYYMDHNILGYRDTLVEGAFNFASMDANCCAYIRNTLNSTNSDVLHWGWNAPDEISGHPYDDPTASGTYHNNVSNSTQNLVNTVNQSPFGYNNIWLTEAGVWLNDPTSDARKANTLGQDVDGDPVAQAYGAAGWQNLANVSGQIGGEFWYQFQTYGDGSNQGADSFDSALLGITSASWDQAGLYNPSAGQYAVPRTSLCVLAYGDSPDPNATNAAEADSRCNFAASPHLPWSDWQDPGTG